MPAKSLQEGLVRMSWGPQNLQALLKLSHSPPQHLQQSFKRSPLTLYQQKWLSKRMLRGYHGDWIQERRLRRRFMPDSLPPLEASSSSSSAASATPTNERNTRKNSDYNARTAKSGQAPDRRIPLASLMWREVEARLDVLLFRACLAYSAREARRLVTQGHVKLNGKKCTDPNITLQPGDIFSVEPKAMHLLQARSTPEPESTVTSESAPAEGASTEEVTAAPEGTAESQAAESGSSEASSSEATTSAPSSSEGEATTSAEAAETMASSEVTAEASSEKTEAAAADTAKPKKAAKPKKPVPGLPFDLPDYSAPFLFIPAYLEVSFPTCSAIYIRHPTARPGLSEIPTPFDADGEVMRLGWEFYKGVGRRRRGVADVGDEDTTPAGTMKDLYTADGKRRWTANWEDTQLEKRHMRGVRQNVGRWANRPL